jgi:hypothetical protein
MLQLVMRLLLSKYQYVSMPANAFAGRKELHRWIMVRVVPISYLDDQSMLTLVERFGNPALDRWVEKRPRCCHAEFTITRCGILIARFWQPHVRIRMGQTAFASFTARNFRSLVFGEIAIPPLVDGPQRKKC